MALLFFEMQRNLSFFVSKKKVSNTIALSFIPTHFQMESSIKRLGQLVYKVLVSIPPFCSCILILWYGMVWYGMVWYGMIWDGMVWYGMVWYGMVWYGMVWNGMVWYGMVWYGMVWYGIVWYGRV